MSEQRTIIQMSDIHKSFKVGKRSVEVLRGIDLSVSEGEMVAIMGASGSGKSTLLNIIGCMDIPDSGTYTLFSESISAKKQAALSRIRNNRFGYVIQDYALIRGFSVWQNIKIPLEYSNKRIPMNRIEKLIKELGIEHLKKTRASLLSGGEQQRVAIARALVNDPDVILADEPTGALDSITGKQIMGILRNIADAGKTVIVVTHDDKVANVSDRKVVINDGKIIC